MRIKEYFPHHSPCDFFPLADKLNVITDIRVDESIPGETLQTHIVAEDVINRSKFEVVKDKVINLLKDKTISIDQSFLKPSVLAQLNMESIQIDNLPSMRVEIFGDKTKPLTTVLNEEEIFEKPSIDPKMLFIGSAVLYFLLK